MEFTQGLKYDKAGLIVGVIQDYNNNQVLMVGYFNKEAISQTLEQKKVTFFSRSKKRLWLKGEKSGHIQLVKQVYFDCDKDALLIKVEQKVAACHQGYRSCFYSQWDQDQVKIIENKEFEPDQIYSEI
ncbi:phosphoribosyl-AMP cyclohydrolase [bacterium K02(2017)]|nr:phosphoribosyl-AMP cyclohydrolase [bacterium K02(2017)]